RTRVDSGAVTEHEAERQEDGALDEVIDQCRREPRTDAGERKLELHAFGRVERQAILEHHPMRLDAFIATRKDDWHEPERLVAERRKQLLIAFVLLFGSAALAALWAAHDPAAAIGVVPGQFRPALQPGHPWHDMSAGDQAAFTTAIFTNNIKVTLSAFAGG